MSDLHSMAEESHSRFPSLLIPGARSVTNEFPNKTKNYELYRDFGQEECNISRCQFPSAGNQKVRVQSAKIFSEICQRWIVSLEFGEKLRLVLLQ